MLLWLCTGCGESLQEDDPGETPRVMIADNDKRTDMDETGSEMSDHRGVVVREVSRSQGQGLAQRVRILQDVELFSQIDMSQLEVLAEAFTSAVYESGDVIIREGDPGTQFYLIQAGTVHVTVAADPSFSVYLGAGHWFGEKALLINAPRMATITAASDLALLTLSREKFQEQGLDELIRGPCRRCVHCVRASVARPSMAAMTEDSNLEFVVTALKLNQNLQSVLASFSEEQFEQLARSAQLETVEKGRILIEEGSTNVEDDCFFIVKEGRFTVYQAASKSCTRASRCNRAEMVSVSASCAVSGLSSENAVSTVTPGMSFGELALLHAAPRNATVQALVDSVVFAINRESLRCIMEAARAAQIQVKAGYLRRCAMFENLTKEELEDLVGVMQEFHYEKDDVILQQGADGDTMYVMVEGKVGVYLDDSLNTVLIASQEEGTSQVFGERALLQNEPRAATVKVLSDTAFMLSCDRESIKFLLSGLLEVLTTGSRSKHGERPDTTKSIKDMVAARMGQFGHTRRKLLRKEGILGFGSLGIIELVRHKETGKNYALKVMSKGYIVKAGLQEKIMHTRDLLIILNSPFVIGMIEAYSGSQSLFFLMESCLGGDLATVYARNGCHGSLVHCKFYVASVIMAFGHMHKFKIIYRDTKPENILISDKGTLKIVDLDCAKFSPGSSFTVCGTPEYLAPEVMSRQGHTFLVDWWGIGVLTFELLAGFTPFMAATPMQVYARATEGIDKVEFPAAITSPGEEFIKKVMVQNPRDRLPAKPHGLSTMKKLKFWQNVDWAGIKAQTVAPPYMPKVGARTKEAKRYNPRPEDMPQQIVYVDDGSGWDQQFATCT